MKKYETAAKKILNTMDNTPQLDLFAPRTDVETAIDEGWTSASRVSDNEEKGLPPLYGVDMTPRPVTPPEAPAPETDAPMQRAEIAPAREPEATSQKPEAPAQKPEEKPELIDLTTADINDYYDTAKIPTGIKTIDDCLYGGLMQGTLTTIAGPEGNGKTTIAFQIAASQVKGGEKVCIYSAEMPAGAMKNIIYHQLAGDGEIDPNKGNAAFPRYRLTRAGVNRITRDYKGQIYVSTPQIDAGAWKRFKNQMEKLAKAGFKIIICDNLLTLTDMIAADPTYRGAGDNTLQAAAAIWAAHLAATYDVWVIMIAHTRKESNWQAQNRNDTISGSSAVKNLSSAIIFFDKLPEADRADDPDTQDRCIALTKNRYFGRHKTTGVRTVYNPMTMTVTEK